MADKDNEIVESVQLSQGIGLPPFDPSKYLDGMNGLDLTEEQKLEFLQNLWQIMAMFVNLGFGVDCVLPILIQKTFESDGDGLEEPIPTHEFNVAAEDGEYGKDGPQ